MEECVRSGDCTKSPGRQPDLTWISKIYEFKSYQLPPSFSSQGVGQLIEAYKNMGWGFIELLIKLQNFELWIKWWGMHFFSIENWKVTLVLFPECLLAGIKYVWKLRKIYFNLNIKNLKAALNCRNSWLYFAKKMLHLWPWYLLMPCCC